MNGSYKRGNKQSMTSSKFDRSKMKFGFKLVLTTIFLLSLICVLVFVEWLVYFIVLMQCDWPQLDPKNEDPDVEKSNEAPVRAMFVTDTHLVGSLEGYWLDKVRTEWQMYTAFQTALQLHRPEVVFVLGDLTDEGQYSNDDDFDEYVRRFYSSFAVPKNIQMYVLVGNHDIGFHYRISLEQIKRFEQAFNSPAAQLITIRGNHFVMVNSVTLKGDGCSLCNATEAEVAKIEKILKCTNDLSCEGSQLESHSKPILLQHYPLYRESDEKCSELDEAPYLEKIEKFKESWECLSRPATLKLLRQINPRLVLDGHTHHGCTQKLAVGKGVEITIASFNWRNKNNPSYGLVVATPNNWAFYRCLMPKQTTAIVRYIFSVICLIFGMMYWFRWQNRWRRFTVPVVGKV